MMMSDKYESWLPIMIDDDEKEEKVTNMIAAVISGGDLFIDMIIAD